MNKEKKINEYNKYFISDNGGVRSVNSKRDMYIKQHLTKVGYLEVHLWKHNKRTHKSVHRLVAEYFIDNPEHKKCVNHIDGNKLNNNYKNLEWVTYQENSDHAIELGLTDNSGENNGRAKLRKEEVEEIRQSELSGVELSEIYKISRTTVSRIKTGSSWK